MCTHGIAVRVHFSPPKRSLSVTYESVAPRVGPLLGLVDLLEPLPAGDSGGRAHVVDLEGLEVDLLLVQLLLNLRVVVMGDEVGNDVEDFEGQVGQVLEHHGALEGRPKGESEFLT